MEPLSAPAKQFLSSAHVNSPLPPALRVASAIVVVASALPFIAAPASGGENLSPTNPVNATTQRPAALNNPIVTRPKVNQVGYLPQRSKCFSITRTESGPHRGDSFRVVTEAGIPVFSGSFSNGPVDDPATRESVFVGDFSELRAPGRYKIEVNGLDSDPFTIGAAVYRPLCNDALRCFYLLRCGVGIDDAQTGIRHSPCHLKDAPPKAGGAASDLTGGWHNADACAIGGRIAAPCWCPCLAPLKSNFPISSVQFDFYVQVLGMCFHEISPSVIHR